MRVEKALGVAHPKRQLIFFSFFFVSVPMIFYGTLAGDFSHYALGSFAMLAITIGVFSTESSPKSLILLAIAISLCLRYIPIIKFNQPLYFDPVTELSTARELEKRGSISILPGELEYPPKTEHARSGWPLLHVLTIMVHKISGLSLLTIFTYFGPVIDLTSLLFVYLLAKYSFGSARTGALSMLIYATFSENMFWMGTQLIRQNIAFSLMLMGVYLLIKGKTDRNKKIVALCLLTFCILPVAHHLTPLEIFYIFLFTFFLGLSLNFWKEIKDTIFHTATFPTSTHARVITLGICLFTGTCMFLWWIIYPKEMIFYPFAETASRLSEALTTVKRSGYFQRSVAKSGSVFYMNLGVLNILAYARLLLLAVATLYGVFVIAKEKNRYRSFLYGFLLAPLLLFSISFFISGRVLTSRHFIFALVPIFVLTAKTIRKFDRKILALCLLVIVAPSTFNLFVQPSQTAPTFIYDRSMPGPFLHGSTISARVVYRTDQVLAAGSFSASYSNAVLISDQYTGTGFRLYFSPYERQKKGFEFLVESIVAEKPISDGPLCMIHKQFFTEQFVPHAYFASKAYNLTLDVELLSDYINRLNNIANCIYNNGEVVGWKMKSQL